MPDIDIDFGDRDIVLSKIQHRVAKLNTGKKHNTGVYVTECPHNPVDNLSTIDYKKAEERGYFKLDFLNVSIYNDVKSEIHLQQLIEKEPQWDLLEHDDFTNLLFHVSGHGEILSRRVSVASPNVTMTSRRWAIASARQMPEDSIFSNFLSAVMPLLLGRLSGKIPFNGRASN